MYYHTNLVISDVHFLPNMPLKHDLVIDDRATPVLTLSLITEKAKCDRQIRKIALGKLFLGTL